ncbi:MAG: type I-F CRISPR-associated protein Csy3 [Desulfurellaceae bacterium]|nr:type I-F CRISPR-associated protein Csy3 [Desulfurellaceae bacterium]
MAQLKTASVLAFERKLANSDGLMYSGSWENRDKAESWSPLTIHEKSIRGTISNRQKNAIASDPLKLDNEVQKPNLQTVDVALLPFQHDTLKVEFTLRILADLDTPSACNDPDYKEALGKTINTYIAEHGFSELSRRYATNIANGRFLWRNRVGAEAVAVLVTRQQGQEVVARWDFESDRISLRKFDTTDGDVSELAAAIEAGLKGEAFTFLKIEGFARLGEGQEVFPSQELILDRDNARKSKTLYEIGGVAGLHSQKIGNALRTIDTWYPEAEQFGPISVEPFGSVTNRGKAYRQPKDKMDFYTLLDGWVLKGKTPAVEQQHYVMAVLVRGGVFGEKSE